ncbi:SASB-like protein, partial [Mya arenaria]
MLFVQKIIPCLAVLIHIISGGEQESIHVRTNYGTIQGYRKFYNGSSVNQFIGVPYAAPPVGDLRFRKPKPPQLWDEVYQADSFPPSCMQDLLQNDAWLIPNQNISEDCLYLSIYVPGNNISLSNKSQKSVMVWIHGGGFTAGQSSTFDGSYLALQGDVIVVTINYRLGLFGFLSTEDEHARGNYGLWDQIAAIEWVHENIDNFGGNKSSVCIFGESAGGYSVGLHTVLTQNRGRIHRAISESGAVYSPRAVAQQSVVVAGRAARSLNCSTSSNKVIINCLKTISASALLKVQGDAAFGFQENETFINRLGPVIDNELILQNPVDILRNKSSPSYEFFKELDIMAGTNNAEGGLMYWRMMKYQQPYSFNISEGIPQKALCDIVAPAAASGFSAYRDQISKAVCDQYSVSDVSLADQARSTVNVYADIQFIIPTVQTLDAHSEQTHGGRSYQYIFTHEPSFTWIQDRPPWLRGANHAGELPFVFGLDHFYPPGRDKPEEERKLSDTVMTYWTNFAKTGDPNGAGNSSLPEWQEFNPESRAYMNLSLTPGPGRHLYAERVVFWTETVPEIMQPPLANPSTTNIPGDDGNNGSILNISFTLL